MVSYCTHADVSAFLQVDAFADGGSATTPSATQVETLIDMAEGRVEEMTDHAWSTAKAISVTDERVNVQKVRSKTISARGRIQLKHYPILSFSQHATPTLSQTNGNVKVWNGNKFLDFLDSDESKNMGSSVTDVVDKDFWVDTENGIIYLNSYTLSELFNTSPTDIDGYISYKYATASTPADVKLATIYLTASMIAMNDDLNLMQEGADSMNNQTKSTMFEDMALKILNDNNRIKRHISFARLKGGLGSDYLTYPLGGV